jgi:hypothetical protein
MTIPKRGAYIFYRGRRFQVEFYYSLEGRLPAKEYLEAAGLQLQVKLAVLVKYIAEEGRLFDITKFRIVDQAERMYEFKPLEHRFFNFFSSGRRIIITNAYRKQSQKLDKKELAKAVRMKRDYEQRVKGGCYYAQGKD